LQRPSEAVSHLVRFASEVLERLQPLPTHSRSSNTLFQESLAETSQRGLPFGFCCARRAKLPVILQQQIFYIQVNRHTAGAAQFFLGPATAQ
jgi:hypothetical protein